MDADETLPDRPRNPGQRALNRIVGVFFTFSERLIIWGAFAYAAKRTDEQALKLLSMAAAISMGAWMTSIIDDVLWEVRSWITEAFSLNRNENAFHRHLLTVAAVVSSAVILIEIDLLVLVPAVNALQPSP